MHFLFSEAERTLRGLDSAPYEIVCPLSISEVNRATFYCHFLELEHQRRKCASVCVKVTARLDMLQLLADRHVSRSAQIEILKSVSKASSPHKSVLPEEKYTFMLFGFFPTSAPLVVFYVTSRSDSVEKSFRKPITVFISLEMLMLIVSWSQMTVPSIALDAEVENSLNCVSFSRNLF